MFKIENTTIYLTRGDKATINLSIEDYKFKVGDIIKFRIYNKAGLYEKPILEKTIDIQEEIENIDIELSSEETKIGDIINKEKIYWYEIELNNDQTIFGYDDKGPKELILYPEGADNDDTK